MKIWLFTLMFSAFFLLGVASYAQVPEQGTPKAEEVASQGQETSVMYGLISNTIHAMHRFVVIGLFTRFAEETKPLFQIMVSIYIFFTIAIWMKTKSIDILRPGPAVLIDGCCKMPSHYQCDGIIGTECKRSC